MKIFLVFLISIFCLPFFSYAQQSDSLAYQLQRKKINQMLDARSQKFGQYTESLSSRTGIFGLKTKKDMQKSINILTEIIQTDNAILKETKTLLDYKTFQQEQVQTKSQESESRNLAYMRTINKLETETEKLKSEFTESLKDKIFYQNITLVLGIVLLAIAVFTFRKISLNRSNKNIKS